VTNTATASTIRPPHRVGSGLSGDDLPLHPRKQKLRFSQAQTQSGDIAEIVGLIDLHDVRALSGIQPVSTHPSVLEGLVDGSHIRWGLRVLKAVVSACLLDGYSADRLGS
jgi:hypothetical protein